MGVPADVDTVPCSSRKERAHHRERATRPGQLGSGQPNAHEDERYHT
ncbi:Hypothetical protein A7982_00733 [Minicystis rosea]|nr:Hypothetical protein A7982_00733 [Minicystis rosea]